MSPSLRSPVFYGVRDETIAAEWGPLQLFIFFPSLDGAVWSAPVLDGTYPLVLFLHGNRTGTEAERLCPVDVSGDYRLWWTALHLMARCGIVVACPNVSGAISADPETTMPIARRALSFMYDEWEYRSVLRRPPNGRLGIAGHSWGANAGLRAVVSADITAAAFAAVAGTWENSASTDFPKLKAPVLFVSGMDDFLAGPSNQPYAGRTPPKHQVALSDLGHWAWFARPEIYPCSGTPPYTCTSGAHILAELLVAFFWRYLYNQPAKVVPYLLEDPGSPPVRPSLDYVNDRPCAARIRFQTRQSSSWLDWFYAALTPNSLSWGRVPSLWRLLGRFVRKDEVTVGSWSAGAPWS